MRFRHDGRIDIAGKRLSLGGDELSQWNKITINVQECYV